MAGCRIAKRLTAADEPALNHAAKNSRRDLRLLITIFQATRLGYRRRLQCTVLGQAGAQVSLKLFSRRALELDAWVLKQNSC